MSKEMTVQEAIKYIEDTFEWAAPDNEEKALKIIPEIILILKRGEAYKKMWEGLEKEWGRCGLQSMITAIVTLSHEMNKLEQKYLKEAKEAETE